MQPWGKCESYVLLFLQKAPTKELKNHHNLNLTCESLGEISNGSS